MYNIMPACINLQIKGAQSVGKEVIQVKLEQTVAITIKVNLELLKFNSYFIGDPVIYSKAYEYN